MLPCVLQSAPSSCLCIQDKNIICIQPRTSLYKGAVLPVFADIIAKAEHYLGGALDEPASIHTVRDVAPNKLMLCVSFRVPEAVAFATSKRAKTDAS